MVSISRFIRNMDGNNERLKYIIYRDSRENQEFYEEVRTHKEKESTIMILNSIPSIERVRATPFRPKRAKKIKKKRY